MRIRCDDCDSKYRVPEALSGKRVRCVKCGKVLVVGEDISTWLKALSSAMKQWGRRDTSPAEQPMHGDPSDSGASAAIPPDHAARA